MNAPIQKYDITIDDAIAVEKFNAACDGYAAGVRLGMEQAKMMFLRHITTGKIPRADAPPAPQPAPVSFIPTPQPHTGSHPITETTCDGDDCWCRYLSAPRPANK